MEIQTRRQILEIWRSTIDYSYRHGEWTWGGRAGRNSISDAEQLLTILYPATAIESLKFDSIDQIADDVLDYLNALGNAQDIPRRLIAFIGDYMETYLVDGTPDFSGGDYFEVEDSRAGEMKPEQQKLDVVDSFSMSVTLCLVTLGFLRVYRQGLRSQRMLQEVDRLEKLSSQRLTAAMVGLLRSFTVNTFDPTSDFGQNMCTMVNQSGVATETLIGNLLDELAEVRAGLREELSIGMGEVGEQLENPGRLFECGWSWGVVAEAPGIPYATDIGLQPAGVAEPAPYLYFTVVALDGIQDLFSERTRILGLLNDEQQRLARALELRWDLARRFWAKVATFGGGRWPLEDLPWKTTDGEESDYYSVLLTSILIEGARSGRTGNVDIERIGRVLEELSNRGRITRRPMEDDQAIALHMPGIRLRLVGSDFPAEGPRLVWPVSSFTLLLLKRLLRVAELLDDSSARVPVLELADRIWEHIERRRIQKPGAQGLWDDPRQVFASTSSAKYDVPSWHHTERVMEALVASANVTQSRSTATSELLQSASELLAEAEHLFDRERLRGTDDTGLQMKESFQVVAAKLRRARDILLDRPGTASVLAGDVLRELDYIDAARQDTARMG